MHTDDWLRPYGVEELETALGKNVLSRILLIDTRPEDEKLLRGTVEDDLARSGPQGVLSLLRTLIDLGEFTRDELLELGTKICGSRSANLFEKLLDMFEGSTRSDLWSRDKWGRYSFSYSSL